jgi:hypothetical protein
MLSNNRFFGNAGRSRWMAGSGQQAYAGALQDWTRTEVAAGMPKHAGVPVGYGGAGLALPRIAGSLSSRGVTTINLTAVGSASRGLGVAGSADISIAATGTAFGVGTVAGSASIDLGASGNVYGQAAVAGSAAIALGATGTVGGVAFLAGIANIALTASSTMGCRAAVAGTAYLSAAAEGATLTEAGIASAVWAQVIEAGFNAEQILRILAAHAAGSATGLEGANPQFTGLDGTTVRIDGNYSAGTRTIDALDGD